MKPKRPSFETACAQYVHRYTMEHAPAWALKPHRDTSTGEVRYYAPQYTTDREWYDSTRFPGEPEHIGPRTHCNSTGQTWPMGTWLDAPFDKHRRAA